MKAWALTLGACAVLGSHPAAAEVPRVAVVVEAGSARDQALARALRARLGDDSSSRLLEIAPESMGDPIAVGRVMAAVHKADLVVSVGDGLVDLLAREAGDMSAYFVGVSLASGDRLARGRSYWLLAYSEEDLLEVAQKHWSKRLGLLHTKGYAPLVERIRAGAQKRGIALSERRVDGPQGLVPAARALLGEAQALWILGDPLLARGAGFEFLVEETLSRGVPLLGASPWEVGEGALLCARAKTEQLAETASRSIRLLLEPGKTGEVPRLDSPPPGGDILVHLPLLKRFGLPAGEPRWEAVP